LLSEKNSAINNFEVQADSLNDYEEEKSELLEKLAFYEKDRETLLLTLDYLKKADETLKLKYKNPVAKSLNKYLAYIDSSKNKEVDVDVNLNIAVNENGVGRESAYYSQGYKNLYDICKRFALCDAIYTKEKPFMILDDPFFNLDDEKINKAIELIKQLSNDYQIIYLVCHESRRA